MHITQDDFAHLGILDQLSDSLRREVEEIIPSELLLPLNSPSYLVEVITDAWIFATWAISKSRGELPQGSHGIPLPPLHHLAGVEKVLSELSPALLQRNFEQRPHDPARALGDVHHVSIQIIALQSESRDVGLQQNVDLRRCFLDTTLDWYWNSIDEFLQLNFFIFSDWNVLEFFAQGKQSEEVDGVHVRLQFLIVDLHRVAFDVVMRGHFTQSCGQEGANPSLVLDHACFLQFQSSGVGQVHPHLNQSWVILAIFWADSVQLVISPHSYVQIGVREPIDSFFDTGYTA